MSIADTPVRSPLEELLRPIARQWWLWVAFGVLSLMAGIVALINPGLSLLAIALLFGSYLIVAGFFDLLAGVTATDADTLRRILAVVLGILSLIAGVICLLRPGAGLFALVVVVGVFLVVSGVIQLAAAVSDGMPWLMAGLGVVNLVLGIIILAVPELGLVTFAILFGLGLVVRGAVAVAAGLRLRRLVSRTRTRTRPGATMRASGS
jgi:uncharacterized membrane protein HdeD (DUF308 family)